MRKLNEINLHIKDFFNKKRWRYESHQNLLHKESEFIKTFSGRIMWLKPTFCLSKDSLISLTRERPISKILIIYPQKVSLISEISSLMSDKESIPFYYFLNNEFNQDKVRKRNEYIFMSKKFFCIFSREYHPIIFPDSNISVLCGKHSQGQLKRDIKVIKNLRRTPIYNLVKNKRIGFFEKHSGNVKNMLFYFFSSNNNHKNSLLYNVIKKAEKN